MLRTDGGDGGMSAQGTGRVWCGQVCVHTNNQYTKQLQSSVQHMRCYTVRPCCSKHTFSTADRVRETY
jgi:hypothetical protein